jgi:GDP-D-mannose dehydratase
MEKSVFYPQGSCVVAKFYAHWIAINYRKAHNMFVCNEIVKNLSIIKKKLVLNKF